MKNNLDNFYFCKPYSYFHPYGGHHFDDTKEYHQWLKVIKYIFDNYDLYEKDYTNSFTFTPHHTPLVGVVDGKLREIPFDNDYRIKPERLEEFKSIWARLKTPREKKDKNSIVSYSISELYHIFDLENNGEEYDPKKCLTIREDGVINYTTAYTFYKQQTTDKL